ncbi:MAG: hypothetical protein HFACDABA_02045 [Anaerolineales bacterium]|nr:hypothetical protein [Anaerolineales bacterium]
MNDYRLFGFAVRSVLNFDSQLERIRCDQPDCEIVDSPVPFDEIEGDLWYETPDTDAKTQRPHMLLYSSARGALLSYPAFGQFEIQADHIRYYLNGDLDIQTLEAILFRAALILWLEWNNMPVMHASSVVIDDSAIGFLAESAGGKSTLAAAFVSGGARLLADDILPIRHTHEYQARPGYVFLRLRPETAAALNFLNGRTFETDPPKQVIRLSESRGQVCLDPTPLAALYFPVRRDDVAAISIETMSPRQTYLRLLHYTFTGSILTRSPLMPRRMSFLAHLAKEIPIKRLVYPSGYEHLPAVVDAVRQDLGL